MKRELAALAAGLLFGLGLAVAQMTDPLKVLAFLDLAGQWDPSLLLVLGGAVIVTFVGYRLALGRPAPALAPRFELPIQTLIDRPLVAGSAIFGIGWGIAGYCPGPAISSVAFANAEVLVFLPALAVGSWLHHLLHVRNRAGSGSAVGVSAGSNTD